MSDVELEQAALAPHGWISLAKQHPNNPDALLHPSTKRIIRNPPSVSTDFTTGIFLVPGGRYLVSCSIGGLCVWDLGYTSNADPKLLASLVNEEAYCWKVNTTSDRMGLIIITFR